MYNTKENLGSRRQFRDSGTRSISGSRLRTGAGILILPFSVLRLLRTDYKNVFPGGGGGAIPYKGLMGTCGQPGYVFRDFCLKQGIDFIMFCLNQGIHFINFCLKQAGISFLGR